ncbi:MAG TPA: hypothetical protein VGL92_06505, partial [Acidimicrobiia bacterium]
MVPVLSLIAALSANAGRAGADPSKAAASGSTELNRMAIPDFNPATWKPTAEMPLPLMESPITFKVK